MLFPVVYVTNGTYGYNLQVGAFLCINECIVSVCRWWVKWSSEKTNLYACSCSILYC